MTGGESYVTEDVRPSLTLAKHGTKGDDIQAKRRCVCSGPPRITGRPFVFSTATGFPIFCGVGVPTDG